MNHETHRNLTKKESGVKEILQEEYQNYLKNNKISKKNNLTLDDKLNIAKTTYDRLGEYKNTSNGKHLQEIITDMTNYKESMDRDTKKTIEQYKNFLQAFLR